MIRVASVLMDALSMPMGVEEMPAFGWTLESDEKCVIQSAYRLMLARDDAFDAVVYDSGRVASDESAHVRVEGVRLAPCTVYFARVRVWTRSSQSEWSQTASFLTGMVGQAWRAAFVSAESADDWSNAKGTYLRREWTLDKPLQQAVICASALGLYHLYVNGARVCGDRMAPGWTSYPNHLCYQTYDVTKMLTCGTNVVGAHVGAGWYKGMMGFLHERNNYGYQTAFFMQMTLRFTDGTEQTLVTDENWLSCCSPVTYSEIYGGERYDARLEQPGWNAPGFAPVLGAPLPVSGGHPEYDRKKNPLTDAEKDVQCAVAEAYTPPDTRWRPARRVAFPLRALTPQPGCRVEIMLELPVSRVMVTPKGERILDFGQNLTGFVRFRVRAQEGALVRIRCFETLDADGNAYFDNLRGAKAEVDYRCRGDGEEVFEELFSFQGFRYVLLAAWPTEPDASDFTACVLHSHMRKTGEFRCSHPLLNQLESNIEWSLRGNFLDIPTDCPQRDERMGWTGDAQIFCRTACFLRNAYPFYEKWLRDVAWDQTEEGGVPHIVPNSLQFFEVNDWLLGQGTHSAAGWADVAVIAPWTLYLVYGDSRILNRQFDSMKKWIDFMRTHAVNNIWNYKLQFGDWLALDAAEGSYYGATPNELTCTAYYAYVVSLFAKICRVLEKPALALEYERLHRRITRTFRQTFFTPEGELTAQTQTAHVLALYFHLTPQKWRRKTVSGLKRLLERTNGHLTTGFLGTPYICHALSANGCRDEAYALLLQEDFPSWLYQVKAGATTIWEHWDGRRLDGSLWSPAMNSFNHYAYGAIGEWLYRVVAGIEIDDAAPGYRHILFVPQTGGGLSFAQATYDSVYGPVFSRWERRGGRIMLTMHVPPNTHATVTLEAGARAPQSELTFAREKHGRYHADMGSGEWTVSYTRAERVSLRDREQTACGEIEN